MADNQNLDEYDIRQWFIHTELEQAQDTFRVVEGIMEARSVDQPKRKRRSDAGQKRGEQAPLPGVAK
jgi:hypothetical protein